MSFVRSLMILFAAIIVISVAEILGQLHLASWSQRQAMDWGGVGFIALTVCLLALRHRRR